MVTLNNIKIQFRKDTLDNWQKANPVLKDGEIAIVVDESENEKLKIGNGISAFNELKFLNQDSITTQKVIASSIIQGVKTVASDNSMATGLYTEALANAATVHGIEARAKVGDDYSFVFNGTNLPGYEDRYESHGEGTFNINPKDGLSGIYIGEENLSAILDNKIPNITVDGNKTGLLGVEHISKEEYERRVTANDGSILSNTIYVISSETIDARGQQIKNVGYPTDLSDAITMQYADEHYLSAHQSLSAYYTKSQTNALSSTFRSGLATTEQLTAYQPKGNYLTAHQSLTAYETKADHKSDISALSNAISSKVIVDGQYAENIQIKNVPIEEYAQLLKDGEVLSNCIYEISSENLDAFGDRIINVAEPKEDADAATKSYVDSEISKIDVSEQLKDYATITYVDNKLVSNGSDYTLKTAVLATCGNGLSCAIENYTITTIQISDPNVALSVMLPKITDGNTVRDFVIRFENTGSSNASVAFVPFGSEDIDYESDSDDWAAIEPGVNLVSFTETKR